MKNKSLFKILSMLWICSMVFTACMSDVELSNISKDILIDESLVVPIGVDTIKIKELLQKLSRDNQVTTDPAGQGTEIYFEKEDSSKYDFRSLEIPSSSVSPSPSLTFPPGSYPANSTLTASTTTGFDLGLNTNLADERVDSVKIKTATVSLHINKGNLNLSSVKITIKFLNKTARFSDGKDEVSFTVTGENLNKINEYPISNFVIKPLGTSSLLTKVTIEPTMNSMHNLTSSQQVTMALTLKDINFDVAYGAFKPATDATSTQTIPLDVSSYLPDAFLKFANPQATITAKTNVGTYVVFRIDYIKAYLKSNPAASEAKAKFGGNDYFDFNMTKPAKPGDFATKTEIFDNINGRTDLLFANAIRPDVLEYKFTTSLNQAEINSHPNEPLFFPSDGKIRTNVKIKIPLYLNAGSNVNWNDTLYIDGGTIGDKVENSIIDSSVLVFKVSNGLPIKASTLKFSLLDSNGAKINTTLDDQNYPINAPTIDAAGKVVISSIVPQTIKINVSKAQFEDLKKAKSVIFNIAAEGKDNSTAIHFTTTDSFVVRLGVFVKGNTVRNLSNN
jgi:hypothetical protein